MTALLMFITVGTSQLKQKPSMFLIIAQKRQETFISLIMMTMEGVVRHYHNNSNIVRLKYYQVLHNITMENVSLKMEKGFVNAIEKVMKKHNYMTKTEFIRESIRDKIRKLEEKEILNDKDLMSQIKTSERNMKRGIKSRKFEY